MGESERAEERKEQQAKPVNGHNSAGQVPAHTF